jgi:hypothetical protein
MRAPLCEIGAAELFDPAVIEDPHPLFARIRARHAISRIGETGVHFVATWDRIEEALAREQDFSANLTGVLIRGDDGLPAALELPSTGANQVIATPTSPSTRCTARSRSRASPARGSRCSSRRCASGCARRSTAGSARAAATSCRSPR